MIDTLHILENYIDFRIAVFGCSVRLSKPSAGLHTRQLLAFSQRLDSNLRPTDLNHEVGLSDFAFVREGVRGVIRSS